MTKRVLLTCWPFVGHISPFMSVALALKGHGYDVAIFTGSTVREAIEEDGISVFPFQRVDESRAHDLVARMDSTGPNQRPDLRQVAEIFREWFVETIPAQIADLEPIVTSWQPDLIITETAMWGPVVVLWEKTGIPVAMLSTMLSCLIPGPGAPISALGLPPPRSFPRKLLGRAVSSLAGFAGRRMRQRVDEIRAGYGLSPLNRSVNEFTADLPLYLVGNVREFDFNRTDLPSSVHYVGPLRWRRPIDSSASAWLSQLPDDRPWIHVTESTLRYGEPFVLRAAMTGLADGTYDVIMTSGAHRDVTEVTSDRLPSHMHLVDWVDHEQLLPRCAAMVSTGGAGTILAAVLSGIPQVVIPTAWDKPDNAVRIAESGAGLRLAPKNCTPENLRAAIDEVVSNPRYAENARRIRDLLMTASGPEGAVSLLENLLALHVHASPEFSEN